MKLEEDSPLWDGKIQLLKELLSICCQSHRGVFMTMFIADHGPIPDRFGDEVRGLLKND